MFESVLIADRGEIASRVIHTVRAMGLKAVAVYSEADADLPFVAEADEAILIGQARPARSYLDIAAILEAAKRTHVQAVHPGYGPLAANADFARRVTGEGLTWVGPSPETLSVVADQAGARDLMRQAGVPVTPGEPGPGSGPGPEPDADTPVPDADTPVPDADTPVRRVGVQILGLADGTVIALGDRDCSVRRRGQQVVEETPSSGAGPRLRARMSAAAVRAGEAVGHRGVGTVECLVDPEAQDFVVLEMTPRLQAEHPITELVTGIDLVEQQLLIAAGRPISCAPGEPSGHAIEFRVYAEDPQSFLPATGKIEIWEEPVGEGIRIDAGYAEGNTVTSFYDPLLAKLCVYGADRPAALARARAAVDAFCIEGLTTNLPFLAELLGNAEFAAGRYDTGLVGRMRAT